MIAERIKFARVNLRKKSQVWLAKELGMTQSNISLWELGKHTPAPEQLMQIAHALEINYKWLLDGDGDMMETSMQDATVVDSSPEQKDQNTFDEVVNFLSLFNQLPNSKRQILLTFMRDWINSQ